MEVPHATAEDVMVARDCVLALHTGASVCIQHISSGNSVELVRTAKKLRSRCACRGNTTSFYPYRRCCS